MATDKTQSNLDKKGTPRLILVSDLQVLVRRFTVEKGSQSESGVSLFHLLIELVGSVTLTQYTWDCHFSRTHMLGIKGYKMVYHDKDHTLLIGGGEKRVAPAVY